MKIYTKTGDNGTTGLIGGGRVKKCDARLECYGTLDELNAALGLAATSAPVEFIDRVRAVQSDLFVIGSHLAVPDGYSHAASLPPLDESILARLEMQIDSADEMLSPLQNFILPGGTETAARLHLARTVCRRAERLLVDFAQDRPVPAMMLTYLNRLSDWLFVEARLANQTSGERDIPWIPRAAK